jgi:polar amino acid transport system permease protein
MFQAFTENYKLLLMGAVNTFWLSISAMFISVLIGTIFGLLRLSKSFLLRQISLWYIEFWRGIPMIVTILLVYFAFPEIVSFIGLEISSFNAMLVACVLWTSANAAEIVRGGILSLPFGQTEAAMSLGMTYFQRMKLVILPQSLKLMIAPMIGLFTLLLKGTAIGFIIGYQELIRVSQITIERMVIYGDQMASIKIYSIVMLFYFLMCFPLSRLSLFWERKLIQGKK